MEESAKAAEAAESGTAIPQKEVEETEVKKHAHLFGAANVFGEWPELIFRVLVLMVLGAALGALIAVLMRVVLTQLSTPAPEKAHLHMATTNLTAPRACAIEALASRHADRPMHLVLLNQHPPQTVHMVYILKEKYPNLNAHFHTDPDDYFESSPLDGFTRFGGSFDLLELAARTLALWRHGGASVDLDRPVMDLPEDGEFVQRGSGSFLQFPRPCHPALQGLLTSIGEDMDSSAEDAISRATKWMCKLKELHGMGEENFTPDKCLGVNVMEDKTASLENLQCPLIQSMQQQIVEQSKPIMDFAMNLLRNHIEPSLLQESSEEDIATTEVTEAATTPEVDAEIVTESKVKRSQSKNK